MNTRSASGVILSVTRLATYVPVDVRLSAPMTTPPAYEAAMMVVCGEELAIAGAGRAGGGTAHAGAARLTPHPEGHGLLQLLLDVIHHGVIVRGYDDRLERWVLGPSSKSGSVSDRLTVGRGWAELGAGLSWTLGICASRSIGL